MSPQDRLEPSRRGFWSLIVTQFQGAFSDNALKNLVIYIGLGMALAPDRRNALVPTVGALFSLPFILFSMLGGQLADRFSKRSVTIGVKIFEIFVMLLATLGLALGSLPIALGAVTLMGIHSAIFGPSKYGILPELLPERELSWGNGIIELWTFMAIIMGTIAGALLSDFLRAREMWSGAILVSLAGLGLLFSLGIPRVRPADPTKRIRINALADLRAQMTRIRGDATLKLAVVGNTYFFFLGAIIQSNILIYGKDALGLSDTMTGALQVAMALGIGTGSYAAGHLSGGKIEYGLIPIGATGLTLFGALMGVPHLSLAAAAAGLACAGFFGGFFIVPIAALIQHRPEKTHKGGVIAASNLLSFVGIFFAYCVFYVLSPILHLRPGEIFLATAVFTLVATIYVVYLLPDSLLRMVLWIATHTVYRIRIRGRENIPERGGALFVCNHISFVDALLLISSTDRFVRFVMYKDYYDRPLIRPLARMLRVIPISSQQRPRELVAALKTASEAIASGEIVCIFAEGQITRIGQLLPFRRGFERIMKGLDAPIVPVNLDGVWGSIFSYAKGRFLWKVPLRFPYPVTVSFGAPMGPASTPFEVRRSVQQLATDAWQEREPRIKPLHRAFIASARRHPLRFAMADARVPGLRSGAALTRSVILSRRLRQEWAGQEMVGILLPASVPAALANLAALMSGKIPVNLNPTLPAEALASCIAQCGITTVLTSRTFLEKMPVALPCPTLMLEDLAARPGLSESIIAILMAWACPAGRLERALRERAPRGTAAPGSAAAQSTVGLQPGTPGDGVALQLRPTALRSMAGRCTTLDDLATIVFSSGSTGEPKGVMLTHRNIASNVEQLGQTFALSRADRMLGILPFFHSFGFTGTFALPVVLGVGVVYHANPLDAKTIGALASRYKTTVLLAAPTFLQIYMRGVSAEDFGSIQFILTGAEKLSEPLAAAFEDRFGVRPMEGYGCTECSPAIAVNIPDYRAAGFRQVGFKRGRIGHPLPGVSVRIVDPVTGSPTPVGTPGLLLVRGPNVMKGYLGREDLTAAAMRDGWYVTGDIASEDEDGFLQITDRLSRFSKIGGEMVPHIRVEETLHALAGLTTQTFAVSSVPDPKKGERLVVLHTLTEDELQACLEKLPQSGLPNLWMPRADAFFRVEALPYLATGKLDLRKIRELALRLAS